MPSACWLLATRLVICWCSSVLADAGTRRAELVDLAGDLGRGRHQPVEQHGGDDRGEHREERVEGDASSDQGHLVGLRLRPGPAQDLEPAPARDLARPVGRTAGDARPAPSRSRRSMSSVASGRSRCRSMPDPSPARAWTNMPRPGATPVVHPHQAPATARGPGRSSGASSGCGAGCGQLPTSGATAGVSTSWELSSWIWAAISRSLVSWA